MNTDWQKLLRENPKRCYFPLSPDRVCKPFWKSWVTFLGTGFLPFEDARDYVRNLGFTSADQYYAWAKSGKRPRFIPSCPSVAYQGKFQGLADYAGYKPVRQMNAWPFEKARTYVRSLGLKSWDEWIEWVKSDKRHPSVPFSPYKTYKGQFVNFPDWLGYERHQCCSPRPFEKAREYVRGLGVKNQQDWVKWYKSDNRPLDIPSNPAVVYKDQWKGMSDWLGNGVKRRGQMRPFEEARDYTRSLSLPTQGKWWEWAKSAARPYDIPYAPSKAYASEWKNWPDWLGNNGTPRGQMLPFEEAREVVRRAKLESEGEWRQWCKAGKRPKNVPSSPYQVYPDKWAGWRDWLGTEIRS